MNIENLFITLAKIIEEREEVKVEFRVERKEKKYGVHEIQQRDR